MSAFGCKKVMIWMLVIGTSLSGLMAQSKLELQNKKKKLQEEIAYTNKLLKTTKQRQTSSMDELVKLKKRIETRAEIIATIEEEIRLIDKKVEKNKEVIATLEKDLAELRKEYAEMLYYTYKNRSSYNRLMFIFSSENFNQAYKRLKYLQQYTDYRKRQAELILKTRASIDRKIEELGKIRKEKETLMLNQEEERRVYTREQVEQETVLTELKKQEKDLLKELKRKQRTATKLQRAIEEIIREEIRKAREAAERAGGTSKGFPMTPEAKKLSLNFSANKGQLPWPVAQGVITGKYGTHPHPVLKQVKTKNNGVDISTNTGSLARAVFEGVVSKVIIIPGEGKSVLIRHGEYLSVYSYMSEVFVKAGDKVTTKQDIGVLVSNKAENKTDAHFELWKGMNTLNPEYWLYIR